MNENVVEAKELKRDFKGVAAVDGIDFIVRKQECYGFLGPNGAGKTTTARMIYCFLKPTGGDLQVFGMSVLNGARLIKSRIGVVQQDNNLDPDLNVLDNLRVFARYFDIGRKQAFARAAELLNFIGLSAKQMSRIDELSGGMKRRLIIARSLLNKPDLLILDEPTTGLDPQARHHIWELINRLKSEGTTVIITTHYMEEAEKLCDRVMIMDAGRVITEGMPAGLIKEYIGNDVIEIAGNTDGLHGFLKDNNFRYDITSEKTLIYTDKGEFDFSRIAAFSHKGGILRKANLEDVFMKFTGRELKE